LLPIHFLNLFFHEAKGLVAQGGWSAPYRTPAGAAAVAEAQGKGFDLLLGRRT
jgi:hypothetical protein